MTTTEEVIRLARDRLVAEARIHADSHPSKDIRFFAQSVIETITMLRAELASAKLYKPCQRSNTPHVPVKAIGPTNFAFYGIVETDEEFAERAGRKIEVTE